MKYKCLTLRININNIRRLLSIVLLLTFIFVSPIHAATTTHYFANSGSDANNPCTSSGSPCKTLGKAQAIIDGKSSGDTVNLYFNRGDTWSMDTDAVSTTVNYGLIINDDDPIVNIDAYGSGDKPIFDGTVSDFSSVPDHDDTTGPYSWSNVLRIDRDDCSVKNIHINGVYGIGISLGTNNSYADNITIESCDITNFGFSGIHSSIYWATRNTTITKNLIHTGGQLYKYNKVGPSGWGVAFTFAPWPGTSRTPSGNIASYNVIYDIAGEGIHGYGYTAEYNIIGDTSSVGIFVCPGTNNAVDTTIRYNLVTFKDWSLSEYDDVPSVGPEGISVADELSGGINSGATAEVYGNIVINRNVGIWFDDFANGSPWGKVRIYNNTVIDSHIRNLYIGSGYEAVASGEGFVENNVSILYDRTGSTHAIDQKDPVDLSTYWTIDNNAFWTTGGSPTVDVDWRKNYVTSDPKLAGAEQDYPVDWDGQSGATYYKDITFADFTPNSGSCLIDTGKTISYEDTFLSNGSDFALLPINTLNFVTKQQSHDSKWDNGAVIFSNSESILQPPAGLSIKIE